MSAPEAARYYLRGDSRPSGDYYCRRCDLFAERAHFASPDHGDASDHARRMQAGRRTLRRLLAAGRAWHRPTDAANLFDSLHAPHALPRTARGAP
jgi:hypothetical protein